MPALPARHVHLDFHTSELIPGVGSAFNSKQFAKALQLGRVNNITLFAKCHHSWCYFPTKVGKPHPGLGIDLLGEQLKVCRKLGVKAPIYITLGWSANDADSHPDWVALDKQGDPQWMIAKPPSMAPDAPRPICSWKFLCIASGYRQHLIDLTREVCELYPVDGIFFDICIHERSYSKAAVERMTAEGVDITDDVATKLWHDKLWVEVMVELKALIQERHPQATVFFNGRANIDTPLDSVIEQTHLELEDLPTTWGGYDKFPARARFFACHPLTRDKAMLAMSGKFHTMWGEFGGFKHADAIRFEAASMIAYGATCSFGDQLHPNGAFDLDTYRNIGEAYAYVEKIEEFGLNGRPCSNLAVWLTCLNRTDTPSAIGGMAVAGPQKMDHDYGVTQMLMEANLDFEAVVDGNDLERFDTVIVTGGRCLTPDDVDALENFAHAGGHVVVIGGSALNAAGTSFVFDVGGTYEGEARYDCDYTIATKSVGTGVVSSPFLNYEGALRTSPKPGTTVLAHISEPYFSRTIGAYCSHQNTANRTELAEHPAITVRRLGKGSITWFAHAIGRMYFYHGARLHRQLFMNALRRVYRKPTVETSLLSGGRVTVVHQEDRRRYAVHLLYASPQQRGRCSVIEDLPVFTDVPVTLRVPQAVTSAVLPLSTTKLKLTRSEGEVRVTVPRVQCHEVVVFNY